MAEKNGYKRTTGYRNFMNQRIYWPLMKDVKTDQGPVPGAISATGAIYWVTPMGYRLLHSGNASHAIQRPKVEGKMEIPEEFVAKRDESASPSSKQDKPEKSWLAKGFGALFNKKPNRR